MNRRTAMVLKAAATQLRHLACRLASDEPLLPRTPEAKLITGALNLVEQCVGGKRELLIAIPPRQAIVPNTGFPRHFKLCIACGRTGHEGGRSKMGFPAGARTDADFLALEHQADCPVNTVLDAEGRLL